LAGLAAPPLAVARVGHLTDSDTYWQIRTGQLILDHGRIPRTDPLSWTAHGHPWRPNSWAFDVLLAAVYSPGARLIGVALVGIALVLAVVASQLLLAARLGAHPVAAGLVVLVATPITINWYGVRPQLVDYAAVPLLLVLVDEALRTANRRAAALAVAGVAAVQTVWVNLHATAPLGIGVVALVGAVHAATHPHIRARVAWLAGAAVVGTLANPYGLGVIAQGLDVREASAGLVAEWLPIDLGEPFMDLTVLVGVATAALAARRRWWALTAVLAALVVAGLAVRRFQPVLAVTAIAVLGAALDTVTVRRWAATRVRLLAVGAATLLVLYLGLAVRALPRVGAVPYPVASVRALPAGCRLFNTYELGGVVTLLRPDVPVGLDSRNDLYGRVDLLDADDLVRSRTGAAAELARQGVTCVLVPPATPLGRQLAADPHWREAHRDPDGSAYLRRDAG
jgi:hypothetical protein